MAKKNDKENNQSEGPKEYTAENIKVLQDVLGKKIVEVNSKDGYKFICDDRSWLMFRLSGTEPILRIYSEAPTEKKALQYLEAGKKIAFGV